MTALRGFQVLPHKKLITKILQRYWRTSRGLSLEVRACAQDAAGRTLLVRESDQVPWRLPGGRVARGETAAKAVQRWLAREGGLEITADPRLYSIYPGQGPRHCDQVALYLALSWRETPQDSDQPARATGMRRAFFSAGGLPQEMDEDTLEWLNGAQEARAGPQVC